MAYMYRLFRGALPGLGGTKPQLARPRGVGGRARRGQRHAQYDFGPRDRGFAFPSHTPSGPRFPYCGDRYPQMGRGMFWWFS